MITIQKYARPESLEEAYRLNQSRRNRIIGGMLWMKTASYGIDTAIDLCSLGLDTIEESDESFSIGAMVTLRDLEMHEGLNRYASNAVKNAVKDIVGVQMRNSATVGGSIWGRFGFSDVLTVFMSLDTSVELYKGGVIPLEKFAEMKKDTDILVRLIVKKTPGRFVYSAMRVQRTDFPILTCAVSEISGEYRCVIGARPGRARIIRDEASILKCGITRESAAAFARFACERMPVGGNLRAGAEYRAHLVRVLVSRAFETMGGIGECR